MSALTDLIRDKVIVKDPSAFIWGKSRWTSKDSISQFLNSYYDAAPILKEDTISGITAKLPSKQITKYDSESKSFFTCYEEKLKLHYIDLLLSDFSVVNIVSNSTTSSLTLSKIPSLKYPFLLINKYFNKLSLYTERITGSSNKLFTYLRSGTSITEINPVTSFTITESFNTPTVNDSGVLEIQLSSWPIIPGTITPSLGVLADYDIDYFFGIIRSTTHFTRSTSSPVNFTYTSGIGSIYIPNYIETSYLTHPKSLDQLSVNEKLIIRDPE